MTNFGKAKIMNVFKFINFSFQIIEYSYNCHIKVSVCSPLPPMNTTPFRKFLRLLALILFIGHGPSAAASTINWGSLFNDLLYDSNGQPLDGSFSFEIGSFGSFIPTYENIELWSANWKVFDRVYDPTPLDPNDGDPEGWNVPEQFFVGAAEHNVAGGSDSLDANPTDVFGAGEIGYLWVFNSKTIVPSSEWALLGDFNSGPNTGNAWVFPSPADPPGTSYEWKLEDADLALIGGVNNVQGNGEFTVDPGTYSLQTHVVPEPSSAVMLLLAAAGCGMRWRKRRSLR
jgi:hypothetical protein